MSSPFQQKFSAKNPVKTFTLKQLERQAKKDDKEMYKNAALLPQINQGDYDYESEDEQKFPGDDSYTYEKKTQVKSDSPLDMYAYVSTAPHFQRLQDNIAAAFTTKSKSEPTSEDKKNKAMEDYYKSLTKTSEKPETETSYNKAIESGITKEQMDKVFNAGSTIFKNN